jgi:hypothetical protein
VKKINTLSLLDPILITPKHGNKTEVLGHRLALEGNKTLKFTKILTTLVNEIK